MRTEDFIRNTCDSLRDLGGQLRAQAATTTGETAEILRMAGNTAAVQAAHWRMFGEMNLGGKSHGTQRN